ncbi:unnamed protein product (macronuclear) [Paramecium tetraurelia]|uniref:Uncharacterized protein n=1 Tax=Paramecium tetraurelia TaxID=5888 RepID=A0DXG3_PARTE|nr:uncharacterized protein GSPATT00021363001 [Paramecium tetraurelia]CAK87730.1 unnamed protein product [Paramecium tetraurelia]|eukprot:XP_001455127.1 hypothetical protein (macronuclear) [Paramecium tetraurelia strain d4-2]
MSQLVSCGKSILIHDQSMDPVLRINPHKSSINCCIWNHNNCVIASCGNDGVIILSRATDGESLLPLEHNGKAINAISFTSSSQYLASGGHDSIVRVWDLKKKTIQSHLKGHYSQINSLHWNSADTLIASASNVGDILVHDVSTQIAVSTFNLKGSKTPGFKAVKFMSKNLLCSGSNDGSVTIFDLNKNEYQCNFSSQHTSKVTGLSFTQSLVCSVGTDQKCYLYSIVDKKVTHTIACENPLNSVAMQNDDYSVTVGTLYGQIYVYDIRMTQKPKSQFRGHDNSSVNYMEYQNIEQQSQQPPVSQRLLNESNLSVQSQLKPNPGKSPLILEIKKDSTKDLSTLSNKESMIKIEQQKQMQYDQFQSRVQSSQQSKFDQSTSKIEDISRKYEVSRVIGGQNDFTDEQKKYIQQQINEQTYQLKKIVQDSVSSMHVDMIRQFQIQQNEMQQLLDQYMKEQKSLNQNKRISNQKDNRIEINQQFMLQVYLVRYDCFKIQQLIPNRIFCILFYAICVIDLILLLFSCSFFILPYQQEDVEQQFIIEKETTDWNLNLNQQQFTRYPIIGKLNGQEFRLEKHHYVNLLDNNTSTYFQKTNFHEFLGYLDYQLANLMLPKVHCLLLQFSKRQTQKIIKNLPQCNKSIGIPITPWFWKGDQIYYLAEICFKISSKDNKLYFEGGCMKDGFIYKKLSTDETINFDNLSLYLTHVDDQQMNRFKFSEKNQKPFITSLHLTLIYYCFLFGISGTIYMILIYCILSIRKRSENQYV